MKKVIALLLTLIMMFTVVAPAVSVGAVAADNSNDIVSTIDENTDNNNKEKVSFFDKISQFFHNIFAKIASVFNAKCPFCGEEHNDSDTDIDIDFGSDLGTHIHTPVTKELKPTEATCNKNGSVTRVTSCSSCGTVISTEVESIPATGDHQYVVVEAVAPTCTEAGLTEGKRCSVCDEVFVEQKTVAAIGHDYKAAVTAPTCTDEGYTTYTCANCGDEYVKDEVAAIGHDYKAVVTAPTCTEAGYTTYTCATCGDSYVADEKGALGHSYNKIEITTSPNCTDDGVKTFTCTVCGYSYTEAISAIGHTAGEEVTENEVAPTCTTDGSYDTAVYCKVCKAELSRNTKVVPALGHTAGEEVTENEVAPTCTTDGSYDTAVYCAVCKAELSRETMTVPAKGHSYETAVTAPTCTEIGYTTYTCKVCGDTYVADEVAALGHSYETVVTAPTCTEVGYTTYTCLVCGQGYTTDIIDALGHTSDEAVIENNVESTCTVNGSYDTVVYCSVCDAELSREKTIVSAKGHSYNAVVTVPTCTESGYTTYTCAVCDDTYVANEKDALGHDYSGVITKAPTCTEKGLMTYTCKNDASHTYTEDIKALDHIDNNDNGYCDREGCNKLICDHKGTGTDLKGYIAESCTTDGYTGDKHCSKCDVIVEYGEEIKLKGHSYSKVVTAPTCTDKGYTTYTCADCDDTYVADEVAALGHNYNGVITTDPTCTTEGVKTYTCQNDASHTYTEKVDALGHKYNAVVTAPTCETAGYTTYTCACGDTYVDDEVAKLGHNYKSVITTAPTCITEGEKTYTCQNDASHTYTEKVDALGHNYKAVVTAPTCTAGGYTTYTCEDCGDSYKADEVAANGHSYKAEVTDPTCTVGGYTTYTCACGNSYISDNVDSLGHKFEGNYINNGDGTHSQSCANNCGTYDKQKHEYSEGNKCVCGDIQLIDKFETKFTGDFLYRVGNANEVAIGSLFAAKEGETIDSENVTVTVEEKVDGTAASGTYTANTTDWTKGTIKFNNTGIVKVTVSDNESNSCELYLEVVDAVNATTATSAKTNNVVLLNNVGFSTLDVANGYTLYGNGFTMTCSQDIYYYQMGSAFVYLDNGTLDNVQVIVPNFTHSILYVSALNKSDYPSMAGTNNADSYYNMRSGVLVDGNCKIINSRISGGRAAIYARTSKLLIDNSRIEGGAVANIHAGSQAELTLRDTTLIQEPRTGTVKNDCEAYTGTTGEVTVMGFSVLYECEVETGIAPKLTIEGSFVQNAWADSSYKDYISIPTNLGVNVGTTVLNNILGQKNYLHSMDLDGDGLATDCFNFGFAYVQMDSSGKDVQNPTTSSITDDRTNKDTVPYGAAKLTGLGKTAYVYTYANSKGTDSSFVNKTEYVASGNNGIMPTVDYTVEKDGITEEYYYDATNGWSSKLTFDLDKLGTYNFSFNDLLVQKYGNGLSYTVKDSNGNTIDKTVAIKLSGASNTEYVLEITDNKFYDKNGKEIAKTETYSIPFNLVSNRSSLPEPQKVAEPGGTPLLVVKSKNSDWTCAIPALEGTQIEYYSKTLGEVTTLTLSDLTPTSTGKQNGTESYWEKKTDDYTLKVSCGVIHDTKQVYGMPVVVNNSGNKMYFTISSTNGYVSTNTASRTVTITYEFTDGNSKTLTFSKTWQFNYADYKNGTQYSYSDFVNGTLKAAGSGCVAPDTLVTLADGSQVRIDQVTYEDELLVWNFYDGEYVVVPAALIQNHGYDWNTVIKLSFSDGTVIKTINEHGYFDATLNEFVMIRPCNVSDYIGHEFVKADGDSYTTVTLVNAEVTQEYIEAYSILTAYNYNFITEGMFSLTSPVIETNFFMPFEVGENMTFDAEKMAEDIAEYGLYEYADFEGKIPYEVFEGLNIKYLKVAVGKGLVTYDQIIELLISEGVM